MTNNISRFIYKYLFFGFKFLLLYFVYTIISLLGIILKLQIKSYFCTLQVVEILAF